MTFSNAAFNPADSSSLESQLYIPPRKEVEQIVNACVQRSQSIWMIEGDYRMGKTSLLNMAAVEMRKKGVVPCMVDFCALTGQDFPDLLNGLAEELSASTGLPQAGVPLRYGTNFLRYLGSLASSLEQQSPPVSSLALLLENLPELQKNHVLADFANLLISLVGNRFQFPGLYRVTVVITGGFYLEFLREANLSTLVDRIAPGLSTTVILKNLDPIQTCLLVQHGMQDLPWLETDQVDTLGKWIYEYTGGHPSLIHSLGSILHAEMQQNHALTKLIVEQAADNLATELSGKPGTFRKNLEMANQKWNLLDTAKSLINADMRYQPLHPPIRILETLGLLRKENDRCALSNEIFRRAIKLWC
jgi:hypothetical protein